MTTRYYAATALFALVAATSHTKVAVKHYRHHPECRTARCARAADHLFNEHRARERRRREAREARIGWAIPTYVVMCESGGTNKPPNSASASGYYQIIVGTWESYGGKRYAPEAWEATKAEQGIVARTIVATSPRGLGEWDCA